jgi:hypothetical protein
MRRRSDEEIDNLIRNVNDRGRLVVDLSALVESEIDQLRDRASSFSNEGSRSNEEGSRSERSTESEEDAARVRNLPRSRYGVDGFGKPPSRYYDVNRISQQRLDEIMANPPEYMEFVYQNRRFKLVPIGTIDPVPKAVHMSSRGSLYYYKTRDSAGNTLPMSRWTKVYLKNDQRRQCLFGGSTRTGGMGLAGLMNGNDGVCLNQPDVLRRRAARPPRPQPAPINNNNLRGRRNRNHSSDQSSSMSSSD